MATTSAAADAVHARLINANGQMIPGDAIAHAARMLNDGRLLAVFGASGDRLLCRADDQGVVLRLRERHVRDGLPLAVIVRDLPAAERIARLTDADRDALLRPHAPVVLLTPRRGVRIAPAVAPNCPTLGTMLPGTPLYERLLSHCDGPLATAPLDAVGRFRAPESDSPRTPPAEADALLSCEEPCASCIGDSIVFSLGDQVAYLRRGRADAEIPLQLSHAAAKPTVPTLAVGCDRRCAVALLFDGQVILSEHIGDLTAPDAFQHFVRSVEALCGQYGFEPQRVVCDCDARQLSTQFARQLRLPLITVQHHRAHVASVLADRGWIDPVIGVVCDGGAPGDDRSQWGCELIRCAGADYERLGHLKYDVLDAEPYAPAPTWKTAAAVLRRIVGENWDVRLRREFPRTWERLRAAGAERATTPPSATQDRAGRRARNCSLGHLFDAAAALLGVCTYNRRSAEAAVALEAAASAEKRSVRPYAFRVDRDADGLLNLSADEAILEMLAATENGEPTSRAAARFHETIAHLLARAALQTCESEGVRSVALAGGCFANRRLLSGLVRLLEAGGVSVLLPRQSPLGNGGLALGQCLIAAQTT